MFIQSFYMFPLNGPCLVDDEQSVVIRVISVKMLRQAENRREGRCSKTTINLLSSVTFWRPPWAPVKRSVFHVWMILIFISSCHFCVRARVLSLFSGVGAFFPVLPFTTHIGTNHKPRLSQFVYCGVFLICFVWTINITCRFLCRTLSAVLCACLFCGILCLSLVVKWRQDGGGGGGGGCRRHGLPPLLTTCWYTTHVAFKSCKNHHIELWNDGMV